MQNLARRSSGIYVVRLAVPIVLRAVIGKREIIISTRTRDQALAKIVAGAAASQWHQRFLDLSRLKAVSGIDSMDHHEILKVAAGSPLLLAGGYLPLDQAAAAAGLPPDTLLRAAAEGKVSLHVRVGSTRGFLVPEASLDAVEPELGRSAGLVIPSPASMPASAVPHVTEGVLEVLECDVGPAVAALLEHAPFEAIALQARGRPGVWFVPDCAVTLRRQALEVAAHQVEALRRTVASVIAPERVHEAREHVAAALKAPKAGRRAHERLSTALAEYVKNRIRHDVESEGEIKRIRNGCGLLIELDGDLQLHEVTPERLRRFRDEQLANVPADENKIRLMHKTASVLESMMAVKGTTWPVMSAGERNKRMRWIAGWFRWLHEQNWIADDPAAPLRGESVQSRAERRRKNARRADEARKAYTASDLALIFSAQWFREGRGELTRKGTYRTFLPFYYWGPLISLLAGGPRIREVSQLYLADFGTTDAGTWFIEFTEDAEDKKLKNTSSRRTVPVHPLLIELGLIRWVQALAAAGYDRLFPELKHDTEKGYGKAATKWFSSYMARLGFKRDGTTTFHSLRHTFINALPVDTPDRVAKQLTGHTRGADVHNASYKKDKEPDDALPYVSRLSVNLPPIAKFDVAAGLQATADAIARKRS
ncbi:MAG: site-specific integrase [Burkholderiales bacterium]|nr:site-specific integrase [Burkholderiales bacterium]